MTETKPVPPMTNLELAAYHCRDGKHLAMVFAEVEAGRCETVSIGMWQCSTGALIALNRSVIVAVADLPAARKLLAIAMQTLPHAIYDDEGMATLAVDGEFVAHSVRAPDGVVWLSLGWSDGEGVVAVPVGEAGYLAKLLAEAEEELVRFGAIARPSVTN
jgi:hypothetical protein